MPDSSSKEPQDNETEASVDLSQLKSFSFGTQWSEASKSSAPTDRQRPGRGGPRGAPRPDRRPGGAPAHRDRRPQRAERGPEGQGGAAARQEGGGGARPEGRGPGRGRHQQGQGQAHAPFRPYESPVFDVCFYPDDNCFSAIIKAMRGNHLTYELFQVAKLFMEKPDRFIASITRKAAQGEKPEKVFICAEDSMPFPTEDEVIAYAMANHADKYFTVEEIEVEPPSGNFTFVNRCPFTKELLGPPNYHKYEETLRKHHLARLPNMPFEKLRSSIETVRDEEVVNQWLESQKKATRYTVKETPEGEEAKSFQSIDDAMGYLRTAARSKVIKQVNYARVPGVALENHKDTEAYKAMDGERMRQQRFPLDTANAIRGRMRREKFSIYKKGSKGVTYVCATKRKFRTPGQVMAPDLDRIIKFLESHQMIKAKDFPTKIDEWLKEQAPDQAVDDKKLLRDLHWLIADGYVTHFEDDSLFVQPVLETGAAEPGEKPKSKGGKKPAAAGPTKPSPEKRPAADAAPKAAQPVEETKSADLSAVAEEAPQPVESEESKSEESSQEVIEATEAPKEAEGAPAPAEASAEPVEAEEPSQSQAEESRAEEVPAEEPVTQEGPTEEPATPSEPAEGEPSSDADAEQSVSAEEESQGEQTEQTESLAASEEKAKE